MNNCCHSYLKFILKYYLTHIYILNGHTANRHGNPVLLQSAHLFTSPHHVPVGLFLSRPGIQPLQIALHLLNSRRTWDFLSRTIPVKSITCGVFPQAFVYILSPFLVLSWLEGHLIPNWSSNYLYPSIFQGPSTTFLY